MCVFASVDGARKLTPGADVLRSRGGGHGDCTSDELRRRSQRHVHGPSRCVSNVLSWAELTASDHPGNLYGIENAGERNARLFFVQARRTPLDEATLAQAQEASFLQQAEEEAPEEQEEDEEESEEEEAPRPKKKKKGRPSKAKPPSKPIADSSDEDIIRQRKKKQPASVKRR